MKLNERMNITGHIMIVLGVPIHNSNIGTTIKKIKKFLSSNVKN